MSLSASRTYSEAEVRQRLQRSLPQWQMEGGCIVRTYRTEGWKGALMVANAIGHLAEAAWHHPELQVSYASVGVRLMSHDVGGITDRDLELAARIEALVLWRPPPDGALSGTPDDPRYRYLRYDDAGTGSQS